MDFGENLSRLVELLKMDFIQGLENFLGRQCWHLTWIYEGTPSGTLINNLSAFLGNINQQNENLTCIFSKVLKV